jgi:hypothetical protein
MTHKTHDLCVKTGTYEINGETKGRWMNVGALMEDNEGRPFLMLNARFNPAGIQREEGRESILVSCFEPQQDGQRGQQDPQPEPRQQQRPTHGQRPGGPQNRERY